MKQKALLLAGCLLLCGVCFGGQITIDQQVKQNAHTLQLVVEDWATQAEGCFPAELDMPASKNSPATILSILRPQEIVNPDDPRVPPVMLSLTDPFSMEKVAAGQLVYVPWMINTGNMTAEGYRIYGIGKNKKIVIELKSSWSESR